MTVRAGAGGSWSGHDRACLHRVKALVDEACPGPRRPAPLAARDARGRRRPLCVSSSRSCTALLYSVHPLRRRLGRGAVVARADGEEGRHGVHHGRRAQR